MSRSKLGTFWTQEEPCLNLCAKIRTVHTDFIPGHTLCTWSYGSYRCAPLSCFVHWCGSKCTRCPKLGPKPRFIQISSGYAITEFVGLFVGGAKFRCWLLSRLQCRIPRTPNFNRWLACSANSGSGLNDVMLFLAGDLAYTPKNSGTTNNFWHTISC